MFLYLLLAVFPVAGAFGLIGGYWERRAFALDLLEYEDTPDS